MSPFHPDRGLRHGDPLAPYLFVLVMVRLFWEIQEDVLLGNWKALSVSRGGMGISHIFFADDLMLFAEAIEHQARVIMNCLDNFSKRSGLNINHAKSLIFCSPSTNNRLKRRLGGVTGFTVLDNLGKYLGVPVLQKRVTKSTFAYILDGMKKKLSNWKADMLSLAGRRVMVQSILATMPVYTMQVISLPVSVCMLLTNCAKISFGGDREDKRKIHLIKWSEVCMPRVNGGLGIRMARDFNNALLAKLAWQLVTNANKLWVTVIKEKYIKDRNFFTAPVPPDASWSWRNIVKGQSTIELGATWRVGNGRSFNFWSDWWVRDKPLGVELDIGIPNARTNATVSDFIVSNLTWNFHKLQEFLPQDKVNAIWMILIPMEENVVDKLYWPYTTLGNLSVSLGYNLIVGHLGKEDDHGWVWNIRVTERCRMFIWMAL